MSTFHIFRFVNIFILLFVSLAFYISAMTRMGGGFVFAFAKYLFVCGQHLAATLTMMLVPFLSGRVTKFWNKLNQLVVQITLCHSAEAFTRVYWITRIVISAWALVVVISWYLWWNSFFMEGYFHTFFTPNSTKFYMHVVGCILLSTLISTHVLHSIFFITLASTIRACFQSITSSAKAGTRRLQGPLGSNNPLPEELIETSNERKRVCLQLVEGHERACELIVFLGNIYGRYMVVEMFAFFAGTLTSIFAFFNEFQAIRLETVVITLLINTAWFCGLCECGQMLINEVCLTCVNHPLS